MRLKLRLATLALFLAVPVADASATIIYYKLADHPDAAKDPPPYGLRYDNLGGSGTGVYTFSLGASPVFAKYDDTGTTSKFSIFGWVFGGKDDGGDYDATDSYYGWWYLKYEYDVSSIASSGAKVNDPWKIDVNTPEGGSGTMSRNFDGTGDSWSLTAKANSSGLKFRFAEDDHRLSGYPEAGENYMVGRGWHTGDGTRDFLFIGKPTDKPPPPQNHPIPEPASVLMWTIGSMLCVVVAWRRRRRQAV